jgi:prevent-host-death family protein
VKVVNMHEAKTTLSQLVEQAENGEEVIIARAGEPVARIVALHSSGRRKLGQWKGKVRMSDDFDAPLPDAELSAWLGDRE